MSMNALVKFWKVPLRGNRLIHPKDEAEVGSAIEFSGSSMTARQFIKSELFGHERDKTFHLSLLPSPYMGNLDKADIFIVLLNPGLGLSDYITEEDPKLVRLMRRVITQSFTGISFPFINLDPDHAWSAGFVWWEKKLRSIIRVIGKEYDLTYYETMKHFAGRIAAIELVPYHSLRFGSGRLLKKMPSAQTAIEYINNTLVPKAARGEITLIVTRKIKELKLRKGSHIVAYTSGEARGAHLSAGSRGGKAILRAIRRNPPKA
jgi:hypothetical protein